MNEPNGNAAPEEVTGPSTPEDVAILYSWANLPGAKYRDFSASRREYRAQQRARQAEDERQSELASARLLEETAQRDMDEAQRALDAARRAEQEAADAETRTRAEEAFRLAEANAQREREEAGRRQQSAETLRLRAQSARKEMMAARKRAEEQAARYAEFDAQYRAQVEERAEDLPGQLDDPYYYTGQVDPAYFASTPGVRTAQATRTSTERKAYVFPVHPGSDEYDAGTLQAYRANTSFTPSRAQDYRSLAPLRDLTPAREQTFEREQPAERERRTGRDVDDVNDAPADNDYYSNTARGASGGATPFRGFDTAEHDLHIRPRALRPLYDDPAVGQPPVQWRSVGGRNDVRSRRNAPADDRARTVRQPRPEFFHEVPPAATENAPPAWLAYQEQGLEEPGTSFVPVTRPRLAQPLRRDLSPAPDDAAAASPQRFSTMATIGSQVLPDGTAAPSPGPDREPEWPMPRLSPAPDTLQQSRERVASRWFALQGRMDGESEMPSVASHAAAVPALVLVSLSGGVGKTSMVATLGRTLSALGEKVLLVDTNTHGLLPYYFGARDLRPGAVRTFTPPPGSTDAAVLMAHYELDRVGSDEAAQDRLFADLTERADSAQRVLVDLSSHGMWLARRLLYSTPFVLVPLAPDMNSILSTQMVENIFADMRDIDGKPVRPYYVLNQYDPALPLHLDVREVLRQSLGDRLLPMMIHRAPAISEAVAEGLTVLDYAPGSPVVDDYKALARWIQSLAAPGLPGGHGARWSER